jgi:hypothetical protein
MSPCPCDHEHDHDRTTCIMWLLYRSSLNCPLPHTLHFGAHSLHRHCRRGGMRHLGGSRWFRSSVVCECLCVCILSSPTRIAAPSNLLNGEGTERAPRHCTASLQSGALGKHHSAAAIIQRSAPTRRHAAPQTSTPGKHHDDAPCRHPQPHHHKCTSAWRSRVTARVAICIMRSRRAR